jgi:hypothetical protein
MSHTVVYSYDFYFGVLHPVARILSRLLEEPQQLFQVFIIYLIYFCRYMFRPLLAIFRWNTQLFYVFRLKTDRLCGLVVRVLGYRSGDPGSIPGTTRKKVVDLERGLLSLVSTTEELLDRKVAAPV